MPAIRDDRSAIAALLGSRDPLVDARQAAANYPAIALDAPKPAPIVPRQNVIYTQVPQPQRDIIPAHYNLSGPEPGTVAGIVLGSVAGFLLICWLIQSLMNTKNKAGATTAMAGEEDIVVRRPRRNSHGGRSRHRHSQMREVSRSPRVSSGRSQVIVEERRQQPPPPRARSIVVEHRVPGDDVVEVIEEHENYRERRGSRRGPGPGPGYR
jgi:hypothetical protein